MSGVCVQEVMSQGSSFRKCHRGLCAGSDVGEV